MNFVNHPPFFKQITIYLNRVFYIIKILLPYYLFNKFSLSFVLISIQKKKKSIIFIKYNCN